MNRCRVEKEDASNDGLEIEYETVRRGCQATKLRLIYISGLIVPDRTHVTRHQTQSDTIPLIESGSLDFVANLLNQISFLPFLTRHRDTMPGSRSSTIPPLASDCGLTGPSQPDFGLHLYTSPPEVGVTA